MAKNPDNEMQLGRLQEYLSEPHTAVVLYTSNLLNPSVPHLDLAELQGAFQRPEPDEKGMINDSDIDTSQIGVVPVRADFQERTTSGLTYASGLFMRDDIAEALADIKPSKHAPVHSELEHLARKRPVIDSSLRLLRFGVMQMGNLSPDGSTTVYSQPQKEELWATIVGLSQTVTNDTVLGPKGFNKGNKGLEARAKSLRRQVLAFGVNALTAHNQIPVVEYFANLKHEQRLRRIPRK